MNQELKKNKSPTISLVVILSFLFISLASWALSSPIGSSPDDNYHLPSIWCADAVYNPDCKKMPNGIEVPRQLLVSECFAFKASVGGSCTENFEREVILYDHLNNLRKLYPGGFYAVLSSLKTENKSLFVIKVRLFNSLLYIFSLVILFLMSRNLESWIKTLSGQVLCLIPLGFFLIPSTNPSSWSLIFLPALWTSIYIVGSRQDSRPTRFEVLAISFFWICVNFARADGGLYSVFALISILILFLGKKKKSPMFYALNCVLLALSTINYIFSSTATSITSGENANSDANIFDAKLLTSNLKDIFYYLSGSAGKTGLGWLDTYVPSFVWESMTMAIAISLILSILLLLLQRNFRALSGTLFLLLIYLSIPMIVLQINHYKVGEWVQPRYMLPMFVIIFSVAVLETKTSRKQFYFVASCLAPILFINYSLSLGANIQRYSGVTQQPFNLSSYLESNWSMLDFPSLYIFVIGTASFGLFLFSLVNLYFHSYIKTDENELKANH